MDATELIDRGFQRLRHPLFDVVMLRERCAALASEKRLNSEGVAETRSFDPEEDIFTQTILQGAALLETMGLPDVRYISGAIIPKYQREGRRFWHVDWWAWGTPETQWTVPPQVGLILYLDQAVYRTGALLVLPGSHRRRSYSDPVNQGKLFAPCVEEEVVEVEAGDAILIDSRLTHAVTGNWAVPLRLALTLWYVCDWERLSADVKRTIQLMIVPETTVKLGRYYAGYDGPGNLIVIEKRPQYQEGAYVDG